jgi:hypothetical protein
MDPKEREENFYATPAQSNVQIMSGVAGFGAMKKKS